MIEKATQIRKQGPKKPRLITYNDYRLFLRDWYTWKKSVTAGYTYKSFAQEAGFKSATTLQAVLKGKNNIASASISRYTRALKLTKRQVSYFYHLVQYNQSKDELEKSTHLEELSRYRYYHEEMRLSDLQFELYGKWYHSAIRELVNTEGFIENPKWIAQQLHPSITPAQAAKSLRLLLELQLIFRDASGMLRQRNAVISTPPELKSLSVRNFNRKMIQLAEGAITDVDPGYREISGLTIAIPEAMIEELKTDIQAFKKRILDKVQRCDQDTTDVYQANFQFFPLLEKRTRK